MTPIIESMPFGVVSRNNCGVNIEKLAVLERRVQVERHCEKLKLNFVNNFIVPPKTLMIRGLIQFEEFSKFSNVNVFFFVVTHT